MREKNRIAIIRGTVVTPAECVQRGTVLIEDGVIVFAGSAKDAAPEPGSTIFRATEKFVVPGLIDTHVHGSHGDDVMLNGADGIRRISQHLLRYGTTAYLPSTVSAHHAKLLGAIEDCVQAETNPDPAAEILGIHVEGPFINKNKKGAQLETAIRDPNLDEVREYLQAAPGRIKIMTLAPELPGGIDLVRLLVRNGVIASLGHSEASYDDALAAIEAGATHATHLFNAMPALHHRKPGLAAACLNETAIRAEIVADGIHVAPEMVRLAAKMKGRDGLVLITDAMSAVGCPEGIYALGEKEVRVANGRCTLLDGVTIASSLLTMNKGLGNLIAFTGMSLADAVHMSSLAPARLCGAGGRKGSLEKGKDADVAILNEDFSVAITLAKGELAYGSVSASESPGA
ncbi:MAG: N-acetylglucosamine-6-phosphate deacetylase [Acidobacteriota bacterium]|nr:N-acetylglucosamine-6-phosphate deacetylase [Acidobacteriota bacterium]